MPHVISHDHAIHYTERGEAGPPVLLLHSTGVGSIQWMRFARKLRPRKCLVPDFLAYSPSESWKHGGPPDWRVDLDAARQMLLAQTEPVDLVGHSYGGHIALHLAHDHPDKVRRMALHEPIAWGILAEDGPAEIQEDFAGIITRFFPESGPLPADTWLRLFVDYWNAPGVWQSLNDARQATWRERYPKVHAEVKHLCHDPHRIGHWAKVSTPTLITLSEEAPAHERVVCELLSEHMPHYTLASTPGGHLAPISHSADVLPLFAQAIALD